VTIHAEGDASTPSISLLSAGAVRQWRPGEPCLCV